MGFQRYISPALAVAAAVSARAQGSCPQDDTVTIQATGVNGQFSGCPTYTGTIVIAPTESAAAVEIDGLQGIDGDLVVVPSGNLQSLTFNSLTDIEGTWNMTGATALSTLSFPQINNVDVIRWTALPQLQMLGFGDTGVETCQDCLIDNTQLNRLDGLNFKTLDSFSATNNPFLNDCVMQLSNITKAFTVSANGGQMNVELPNLEWAYNLTLNGISSLNLASLEKVNGSLGFNNVLLDTISLANLTTIGGTLSFDQDDSLTEVDMPELTTINGGLTIYNCSKFENVTFNNLETVGGAVDFDGSFTTVSLPAIKDVRGAFKVISDKDISQSCSNFQNKAGSNKAIKGEFDCTGNSQDASTTTNGDGSTTSGSSTSSSHGAASGLYIPATTGLMGVIAAIFGLL